MQITKELAKMVFGGMRTTFLTKRKCSHDDPLKKCYLTRSSDI